MRLLTTVKPPAPRVRYNFSWILSMSQLSSTNHSSETVNCSACLEPIGRRFVKLSCGHSYHQRCVNTFLSDQRRCSICGTSIDLSKLNDDISSNISMRTEESLVSTSLLLKTGMSFQDISPTVVTVENQGDAITLNLSSSYKGTEGRPVCPSLSDPNKPSDEFAQPHEVVDITSIRGPGEDKSYEELKEYIPYINSLLQNPEKRAELEGRLEYCLEHTEKNLSDTVKETVSEDKWPLKIPGARVKEGKCFEKGEGLLYTGVVYQREADNEEGKQAEIANEEALKEDIMAILNTHLGWKKEDRNTEEIAYQLLDQWAWETNSDPEGMRFVISAIGGFGNRAASINTLEDDSACDMSVMICKTKPAPEIKDKKSPDIVFYFANKKILEGICPYVPYFGHGYAFCEFPETQAFPLPQSVERIAVGEDASNQKIKRRKTSQTKDMMSTNSPCRNRKRGIFCTLFDKPGVREHFKPKMLTLNTLAAHIGVPLSILVQSYVKSRAILSPAQYLPQRVVPKLASALLLSEEEVKNLFRVSVTQTNRRQPIYDFLQQKIPNFSWKRFGPMFISSYTQLFCYTEPLALWESEKIRTLLVSPSVNLEYLYVAAHAAHAAHAGLMDIQDLKLILTVSNTNLGVFFEKMQNIELESQSEEIRSFSDILGNIESCSLTAKSLYNTLYDRFKSTSLSQEDYNKLEQLMGPWIAEFLKPKEEKNFMAFMKKLNGTLTLTALSDQAGLSLQRLRAASHDPASTSFSEDEIHVIAGILGCKEVELSPYLKKKAIKSMESPFSSYLQAEHNGMTIKDLFDKYSAVNDFILEKKSFYNLINQDKKASRIEIEKIAEVLGVKYEDISKYFKIFVGSKFGDFLTFKGEYFYKKYNARLYSANLFAVVNEKNPDLQVPLMCIQDLVKGQTEEIDEKLVEVLSDIFDCTKDEFMQYTGVRIESRQSEVDPIDI